MTENYVGENVLITLQDWFYCPDGENYKVVWGKLKSIKKVDDLIGFAPNRPNVNWLFEIGEMIIYGCQVKTIIKCKDKPKLTGSKGWITSAEHGLKLYDTPNVIWVSE